MFYQVQGNTLLGRDVVDKAALAFTRAQGTMADRVMAAMEAADANGGDHRCNWCTNPLDYVPCDDMTAHVAYILIAEKGDQLGTSFNDGKDYADPTPPTTTILGSVHQARRERQPGENAAEAIRRVGEGRRAAKSAAASLASIIRRRKPAAKEEEGISDF